MREDEECSLKHCLLLSKHRAPVPLIRPRTPLQRTSRRRQLVAAAAPPPRFLSMLTTPECCVEHSLHHRRRPSSGSPKCGTLTRKAGARCQPCSRARHHSKRRRAESELGRGPRTKASSCDADVCACVRACCAGRRGTFSLHSSQDCIAKVLSAPGCVLAHAWHLQPNGCCQRSGPRASCSRHLKAHTHKLTRAGHGSSSQLITMCAHHLALVVAPLTFDCHTGEPPSDVSPKPYVVFLVEPQSSQGLNAARTSACGWFLMAHD